jgi:cytoskeletal protein CcmA (bactofilin family)
MNCPSALFCSLYVDRALSPAETDEIERHVAGCAACTALVAAFAAENRALREVLQTDAAELAEVKIPAFRRPLGLLDMLGFGALTAAYGWLAVAVWTWLGELIPLPRESLNLLGIGELLNIAIGAVLFVLREGVSMIATTIQTVSIVAVVTLVAAGAVGAFGRRRAAAAMSLSLALAAASTLAPSRSDALELRRNQGPITIAAGETIDDSLVLLGGSIEIDGTVNGDLIAIGASVIVRGNVTGDLIACAESVTVEGSIGGNTFGFARNVAIVGGARVQRNLYGFGRDVTVATDGGIDGNALMFGSTNAMRGRVGVDLMSFAADHEISGTVTRNATAFGNTVRLLASARIGGDLVARLGDEENLQVAPGAMVGGATDVRIDERRPPENQYQSASYYFGQVVRLASAFVVGLLLLWMFPGLRTVSLPSGGAALRDAGIGLLVLIGLPIACVIALVTIVGIPIGVLGVMLWLVGLYLAKIVLAVFIGRLLFAARGGVEPHHAALLLAGLVLVLIVVNLPGIGGFMNFVLTILGLGMLVTWLLQAFGAGPRVA